MTKYVIVVLRLPQMSQFSIAMETNIISSDAYRDFWGLKHCIFMDIHFKGKIYGRLFFKKK